MKVKETNAQIDSGPTSARKGQIRELLEQESRTGLTSPDRTWLEGQETKHLKIGHVKIDRAHFRAHFREHWKFSREHWKISREHFRGSLRGDPLVRFTQKKTSTFMGISVDIFVYTPVCIFVSTFVREFVGHISRLSLSD